jgi:hypothetical protein
MLGEESCQRSGDLECFAGSAKEMAVHNSKIAADLR